MKKKSAKVIRFLDQLHEFITRDPQFRKDTRTKGEAAIQAEIRPLIINFLTLHYEETGYKDAVRKANSSFYWEGQEGRYGKERRMTFASRNYPDFIITEPYLIAIEYKQSNTGSTIKHGIGQSMLHTLCEEFHYVYFLFHDQTKNKRIEQSTTNRRETFILERMWDEFNVMVRFV